MGKLFTLAEVRKIASAAFIISPKHETVLEDFDKWFTKRTRGKKVNPTSEGYVSPGTPVINDLTKTAGFVQEYNEEKGEVTICPHPNLWKDKYQYQNWLNKHRSDSRYTVTVEDFNEHIKVVKNEANKD